MGPTSLAGSTGASVTLFATEHLGIGDEIAMHLCREAPP